MLLKLPSPVMPPLSAGEWDSGFEICAIPATANGESERDLAVVALIPPKAG
jgi:hypothetical protein